MKKNYVIGTFCAALMALVSFGAWAQGSSNSSFSISPPPIADPVFNAGEGMMRFTGQAVSMEMDMSMDVGGTKIVIPNKQAGIGFNMVGRKAASDSFAFNFAFGMSVMSGSFDMKITGAGFNSTTTSDNTSLTMPLSGNIEWQLYKGPVFNTILFGGLLMNMQTMSTSGSTKSTSAFGTSYSSFTSTTNMVTTGGQFGAQMGWQLGNFHIDAFGLSSTQGGTATTESSAGGSQTITIPAYTSSSFGGDIKYIPWNLSLSSMVQDSKQENSTFKIRVISLSWSNKF